MSKYTAYSWGVQEDIYGSPYVNTVASMGDSRMTYHDDNKESLINTLGGKGGYYSIYGEQEGYVAYVVKGELLDDWKESDQEKINNVKQELINNYREKLDGQNYDSKRTSS